MITFEGKTYLDISKAILLYFFFKGGQPSQYSMLTMLIISAWCLVDVIEGTCDCDLNLIAGKTIFITI